MSWTRHTPRHTGRPKNMPPAPETNPLVSALSRDDFRHFLHLLQSGASPDRCDGNTNPMIFAARRSDLRAVDQLLAHRGNIDAPDTAGMTALMVVAAAGNKPMYDALLARGACIDAQDKSGMTTLMHAVRAGAEDSVRDLILSGADVDLQDHTGEDARNLAHQCIDARMTHIIDTAVQDKARMDKQNRAALQTPLKVCRPLTLRPRL